VAAPSVLKSSTAQPACMASRHKPKYQIIAGATKWRVEGDQGRGGVGGQELVGE